MLTYRLWPALLAVLVLFICQEKGDPDVLPIYSDRGADTICLVLDGQ